MLSQNGIIQTVSYEFRSCRNYDLGNGVHCSLDSPDSHMGPMEELEMHKFLELKEEKDDSEIILLITLRLLCEIESYLRRKHRIFRHLDVRFTLVGSLRERTKVGKLDEADIMIIFRGLDGRMQYIGVKTLRLEEDSNLDLEVINTLFDEGRRFKMAEFLAEFASAVQEAMEQCQSAQDFESFNFREASCLADDELHPVYKYQRIDSCI